MRAKKALEGARQAEHQEKAPSTQAAEFVREESNISARASMAHVAGPNGMKIRRI
jgi:hypothetical protein